MRRFNPLLLLAVLAVAACGGDDAAPGISTTTGAVASAPTAPSKPSATTTLQPSDPIDVSITTSDGLDLDATLYPGGSSWVVLAHMLPADKTSWTDLALRFQDEGYSVLAYNNRGYGDSAGSREPYELRIDAEAALAYATTNGAGGIVFGGASMNGAAAMTLGAFHDFGAIFVLSGVPSFPSVPDAADLLPEINEPVLFVAAEDDGSAAEDARAYVGLAVDPYLFVLEVGGHGTRMLDADAGLGDDIVQWVIGFAGP